MAKFSSKNFSQGLRGCGSFLRGHSDFMLMAVALALAGSALYVFYLFIYRPVFTSVPPTVPEAAFDVRLYKNVLNGINSNGSDLRNELDQKLPNPF